MATSMRNVGNVVIRGGASLVKRKPIFSADSKYVFVCSGHVIRVFSVASGDCVKELWGHRDEVTAVRVNPAIKLQIFSSSLDSTIRQWDYADGIPLKTFSVGSPVHNLLVHPGLKNKCFVIVEQKSDHSREVYVNLAMVNLPRHAPGETIGVKAIRVLNRVQKGDRCTSIGSGAEYVAAINGCKLKVFFMGSDRHNSETVSLSDDAKSVLTCVSCHPTDYTIATGNVKGHVILWRNFHHKAKVVISAEHWHSLRVEDVCYSPEGSYLFSVGHECVLVQWHYNSKKKDYLPRLGAPISHVTCSNDNQYRALCLTSNAILLIKLDKIIHKIQGLSFGNYANADSMHIPTGLTTDPHTKALVLNGPTGHLQFYQLQQDKLLYNLDIVGENYISPENLAKQLVYTEVERVAFDAEGDWLATVERRDDRETAMEMRLKFWQFDEEKQSFKLNTTIESPHEARINVLCLRSARKVEDYAYDPMAVTTANDEKFKLWRLQDDADINSKNKSWNCVFVGVYRNLQPNITSFSEDGSLLAVAFSQILTIWDPEKNMLKKTFCHGTPREPIKYLEFGSGSSSCHLVAANQSSITVWNLLTCTVLWNVNLQVNLLITDQVSGCFAVLDIANNLFVFNTAEPRVVYAQKCLLQTPIEAAIFTPLVKKRKLQGNVKAGSSSLLPWEHVSQLYLMTRQQDLFTLVSEQRDKEECDEFSATGLTLHNDLSPTPFAALLGREQAGKVQEEGRTEEIGRIHGALGTASIKQMLSSPAYVLPPAKTLCSSFLKTLLPPADHIQPGNSQSEDEDEDDAINKEVSDGSDEEDADETKDQSEMLVDKSHEQEVFVENADEIQLSDQDVHKLEKAARTGFKWMKPIFKDVLL